MKWNKITLKNFRVRDGEQHAFQEPAGAYATESAPALHPFSKIILFHFMMEPRVK